MEERQELHRHDGGSTNDGESAGLKELKLLNGTTVAGHWDQAALNGCCHFNALLATGSSPWMFSGSKPTIAQAAGVPHTAARAAQQCFQSSRPAVQFQPDGNGKTARYPAAVSWQKSTSVPGQCPVGHGALCGSWQNPAVSALRPENC